MNNHESIITLSIKEADADKQLVFLFHVQLDGEVIVNNKSLSEDESQSARDLSAQYNALFESHDDPVLLLTELKVLGVELFNLWFKDAWPLISQQLKPGARRTLIIASDIADVLNLPWELIQTQTDTFAGLDPKFTIRRLPSKDKPLAEFASALRPRPVRILFMACAPQDVPQLDFEREEEAIFKVLAKAGTNIAFHSGDAGSFDELRDLINEFDPHIVHLTGHGAVKKDGLGYFYFEDERGAADPRSSIEMREELFGGSNVQLAFISGCQTGKAPPVAAIGGICQGLVSEEIPLAIGWAASIADDIATDFAAAFYRTLATGQTVDRALIQARPAIKDVCDNRGYPGWTLPVLYCATTQSLLFDARSQPDPPPRRGAVQRPLEGMTEGYAEHFVGRRREIQRLLPAMREGAIQTLILTGIGGAGKSTLATRLARKLESDGWKPIPISSTKDVKLSAARLIQSCGDAFLDAGLHDAVATLNNAQIPVDMRLRFIISTLNKHPFLLVLDNFEENLDEQTRGITDENVREFYKHLLSHLVQGSRAIITCRYLPSDVKMDDVKNVAREEALGDFPEPSFMKFLMRDAVIERRYQNVELPRELLRELHRLFGGTPRFIAQIREAIKTMTADVLKAELEKVKLPAGVEKSVLEEKRDRYCEEIFTARLYGYLSEESRRALSRIAVYNTAVSVEGIAAAAGIEVERARDFLREWQNRALACKDIELGIDDLWSVYGLLRRWLLSPERLSEEDRLAAHHAAGDFLREMVGQKRAGELGMNWVACLTEARAQYIEAKDYLLAREATDRISGFLTGQGLYDSLVEINHEMLECEEHPGPMSWIARAYLDRGDYAEAREWYERCLATAGESEPKEAAVALHQLASIDLNVGDYDSARLNFQKSLEITQQIGDRAGEAATFYQLGIMAYQSGRAVEGMRLVAMCFLIDQSIGHGDTESDFKMLSQMAAQLSYTQEQFDAMLGEVIEAYKADRGRGLIDAAFQKS